MNETTNNEGGQYAASVTAEDSSGPVEDSRSVRERRWARVRLLWSERKALVRATVWGAALSVLIAFLIPTYYQSTTQLMPPQQRQSLTQSLLGLMDFAGGGAGGGGSDTGGGGGGLGSIAGALLGNQTSSDLFVGVLKSATVEDSLIDQFDLRKVYHEKTYLDAQKKLEDNTDLSTDRKTGLITIAVSDRSRERAQAMAAAYVAELNKVMLRVDTSDAHKERVFLEGHLKDVKRELNEAEVEFSAYSSKSGAIDITEQGKAMLQAAAILQGQLIAAESELQGLQQIYTPDNVRVRSAEAQVETLKKQLEKFGGKAGDMSDLGTADYPTIRQLPLLGVTYANLYRKVKVQEAVYIALTQQYEMARAQEAGEAPVATVLDPANFPEKKSFPPRTVIAIVGTLSAFLGMCVYLLFRERWRAMDYNDPRRMLGEEVMQTAKSRWDRSKLGSWVNQRKRRSAKQGPSGNGF